MRAWILWAAATAILLGGGIAALHARPALLGASCPFGKERRVDAAELQRLRHAADDRLRGEGVAPPVETHGFVLGRTTRAEVLAARSDCGPGRDGVGLACPGGLFLDFDGDGRLVALMSMSYAASPQLAELAAERARLDGVIGAPSREAGEGSTDYLAAAPLRQSRADYRRANLYASLSVTNLGRSGYLLSILYRAVS